MESLPPFQILASLASCFYCCCCCFIFLTSLRFDCFCNLKPWPNRLASVRKLKPTCQSVWPGLACTWVDMWWLALSLLEIKSRPGDASISTLGQPTQVNVSWETSSRRYSNLKFCNLRVLARRLASQFGHSKQASAHVQLTTSCEFLRVRLAGEDWHFRGEVRLWCLSYNSWTSPFPGLSLGFSANICKIEIRT